MHFTSECWLRVSFGLLVTFYVQAGIWILLFLFLSCRSSPAETNLKRRSYSDEVNGGGSNTPVHRRSVAGGDDNDGLSSVDSKKLKNKLRNSVKLIKQGGSNNADPTQ